MYITSAAEPGLLTPTVGSSLGAMLPLCPPSLVAESISGGGDVGSEAAMSCIIRPASVERSRKAHGMYETCITKGKQQDCFIHSCHAG